MSRRLMLKQGDSAPELNGLLDKNVSAVDRAYDITNNQFEVTALNATSIYCSGMFKFPFEIKTGDVIFLKLANATGYIGSFQKVRFYTPDPNTVAFVINDNVAFAILKKGITVTVTTNATVGYLSFARKTGDKILPAIFTPILQINGVDMIN